MTGMGRRRAKRTNCGVVERRQVFGSGSLDCSGFDKKDKGKRSPATLHALLFTLHTSGRRGEEWDATSTGMDHRSRAGQKRESGG